MGSGKVPATALTIKQSVIQAAVDDETLILDVENGTYFGVEGAGARIWEILTEGATEGQIVDQLLAEYEAEPARIRADVREFIQILADKGLLEEVQR